MQLAMSSNGVRYRQGRQKYRPTTSGRKIANSRELNSIRDFEILRQKQIDRKRPPTELVSGSIAAPPPPRPSAGRKAGRRAPGVQTLWPEPVEPRSGECMPATNTCP